MYCKYCGKELGPHARQCPNCGEEVTYTSGSGLIVAGYVCAGLSLIIFPLPLGIAGAIIGAINIGKGRTTHGIVQIVLSVVLGMAGALLGLLAWGLLF